jgi:malate dehydrogenase (oxaloacetate-decarboxylating)
LGVSGGERVGLVEAIKMAAPTILLGSSTCTAPLHGRSSRRWPPRNPRPVIMPLSSPTSRMEAMPADVLALSDGKALVATSSPSVPVEYNGATYRIGQSNNALVFPGIGRGVIIAGARRVTKNVLSAAAKAVASKTDPTGPGAALLPGMENLREISTAVAAAVYHAAVQDAVATKEHHDLVRSILDIMWIPEYQTGEEI